MRLPLALPLVVALACAGGAFAQNGTATNGGAGNVGGAARVVLVQGVAGTVGAEFAGALRQRLGGAQPLVVADTGDPTALADAQLIVAAGAAALAEVWARKPGVPVVAALLPRAAFEAIVGPAAATAGGAVSAIHLDQPFARQLAVLRTAMPGARRLGVLLGPDSARSLPLLERAASDGDWQLLAERADGAALRAALGRVLEGSDVLLVLPDPQVFSASSLQAILLGAYRQGKPMVGVSPAYTRAGALFSVFSSPAQLAVETAELVRLGLAGRLPPARHAHAFDLQVNRQVARSLGIDLPDDEDLRAAAAALPR